MSPFISYYYLSSVIF